MVAERDGVGAGGEERIAEASGDAAAVGDVLAVDHDEIELELVTQARDQPLDGLAARVTDHVGDEEDAHGGRGYCVGPGAGSTVISTLSPPFDVYCATSDLSTAEVAATVPMRVRPCSTCAPTCIVG